MRKRLLLFLFLFVACTAQPAPIDHPWGSSLRVLDPADATNPSHDIIAVYLREQGKTFQIRIDLLDFSNPKELSIDIRIESDSTPETSPLIIRVPSQSESVRIDIDPQLDTIIIDIPLADIPASPRVDVSTPEDSVTGLTMDGPIPAQAVPLLLTFTDTFSGRLPAETLRSWDGAHTGPRGERHGLKHLLDAVEEYQVPVVLLDLKEPQNLSALDAIGVLPRINSLESQGLLLLPSNNQNDIQFTHLENSNHLYQPLFSKTTYLPIAAETEASQPTADGPSIEIRRLLLETAFNSDEEDLLVFGGSLADSTWGSPDMVGATMAYFASRPYIRLLNADDLSKFPSNTNNAIIPQPEEPVHAKNLHIEFILEFAQNWAEKPATNQISHCQTDLPTETPDCVLSNDTYLAIFDAQTGSLTYLFTSEHTNLQQLIGPSWQVAPGIDLYPRAFADGNAYQPSINENILTFLSTDGALTKIFTLSESGLEVTYHTQEPITIQIPLIVDPDTRFTSGWAQKYKQENTPGKTLWGLENGTRAEIRSADEMIVHAFNETLSLLTSPEDPDFSYPPGHYIPFPMAIVEIKIDSPISTVHISVLP